MRIVVFEFRSVKKKSHLFKVSKYQRVGLFNKGAGVWSLGSKITLTVNKLNKRKVILSANLGVIFTKSGSNMNNTCTVGHSNVTVTGDIVTLFVLFFTGGFYEIK